MSEGDTIFASATGPMASAIGIVRISGPRANHAFTGLFGTPLPEPRSFVLGTLRDHIDGLVVDRPGILRFAGPCSYTGEDLVEIHHHGAPAIARFIRRRLGEIEGLRPAERGEFTRRALRNGKVDIFEAEAVADMVDAESLSEAKIAASATGGGGVSQILAWSSALMKVLSEIEAEIDFGAEENIEEKLSGDRAEEIAQIVEDMDQWVGRGRKVRELNKGLVVVVFGRPNVGKSSLLNNLVRRDIAIVSDEPGTTRDAIEVALELGDHLVTLVDTAGLREVGAGVEQLGIVRARQWLDRADLRIWLSDRVGELQEDPGFEGIRVVSKVDEGLPVEDRLEGLVYTSAHTGFGLDLLLERIREYCDRYVHGSIDEVVLNERQCGALDDAVGHMRAAARCRTLDIQAEEVRLAVAAIGRISGAVSSEDVLDEIFSKFCIGK